MQIIALGVTLGISMIGGAVTGTQSVKFSEFFCHSDFT